MEETQRRWDEHPDLALARQDGLRGICCIALRGAPDAQLDALARMGAFCTYREGEDAALLYAQDEGVWSIEKLTNALKSLGLQAGLSGPFALAASARGCMLKAQLALETGLAVAPGRTVYPMGEFGEAALLRAARQALTRQGFVPGDFLHEALGRMARMDAQRDTQYLRSLDAYLGCGRDMKRAAQALGVPLTETTVTADDFFAANRAIQWYLDEPMPNPAEVPLYFLAQNARKYVKVVLSGEGADELFGGYPMYCQAVHFMDYERKVPKPLRKCAGKIARKLPEGFKGKHFLVRGSQEPWQRYLRANYVFADPAERDRYLKKDYHSPRPETFFKPYFDKVSGLDEPTQLQWVDMHTWMLYDILLKADRMSMANSLELRVPFLDREMLDVALSIPQRYRSGKEETKIALRGAALKQLPESVAHRKKLGLPVPLNDWLREDKYYNMVREKFTGPVAEQFFNTGELLRLLDDHKAGRAKNMTKIWSFYSFILWYELYFVNSAPPAGVYGK